MCVCVCVCVCVCCRTLDHGTLRCIGSGAFTTVDQIVANVMISTRAQNWVTVQAALTLSEEAERSRPFASALGQLMMTQRASEAAAKQVAVVS